MNERSSRLVQKRKALTPEAIFAIELNQCLISIKADTSTSGKNSRG
jgi:hypothetical protein